MANVLVKVNYAGEEYKINLNEFITPSFNNYTFPSIFNLSKLIYPAIGFSDIYVAEMTGLNSITITNSAGEIYWQEKKYLNDNEYLIKIYRGEVISNNKIGDGITPVYQWISEFNDTFPSGVYSFEYKYLSEGEYFNVEGQIALTYNKYPLKKWTITDVINRCFDTLEAQKLGEKPRFKFQGVSYNSQGERENSYASGSQAEYYDKILSPEFSFTKMTLREMLQQVGGFIHGEPRITNFELEKSNGKLDRINYTVAFDKYGSKEYSHIKNEEYFSTGGKKDIKNFCKKDKKFSKNPLTIIFLYFILCIQ